MAPSRPALWLVLVVLVVASGCGKGEYPCGIDRGCVGGSCDVTGGPDEVCTNSRGEMFEMFCNVDTGEYGGWASCNWSPPCLVGPCPRSAQSPCGVEAGCVAGSCDTDGTGEVCRDAEGHQFETYCNEATGEWAGGGRNCDDWLIDASVPDAATPDAALPDATSSDAGP
jgi:hypothetical protein